MLKNIILELYGLKGIEEGELINPIDEVEVYCYLDKNLKKRFKCKLTKNDIIEVQIVTNNEIIGYIKDKNVYVLIDKYDLSEFEPLN